MSESKSFLSAWFVLVTACHVSVAHTIARHTAIHPYWQSFYSQTSSFTRLLENTFLLLAT